MKFIKTLIMALFLCLAPVIPVVLTGCHQTPAQITYKTLSSVGAGVDASMKLAASLKASGKLTDAQWQQVVDTFNKEQAAYNTAVSAAAIAVGTSQTGSFPATSDLVALATDVSNLVNSFNK